MDSAQRSSPAELAEPVSLASNLLATAAGMGEEQGVWLTIWRTFLCELNKRQQWKWSESFMDGSFAFVKRGSAVDPTKRVKGTKWMVVVEGCGVPLGVRFYSAPPSEVRLAEEMLQVIRVGRQHRRGQPR